MNGTTDRPLKLAGKVDNEGNCRGSSFSDFYGSWDDVVVIGQIFITLQDYYATVQVDKNEITLRSRGSAQRIKDKSFNNYAQEIYSLTTEDITFALAVRGIIQKK
ncbi:hypothetical protein PV328_012042, partial [Microctonus aethiopoides]